MTSFKGNLEELDEEVRQQRHEQRQALTAGDDATFTLINPDFAEGFCWYNSVQATRPMGWILNYSGTLNVKTSMVEKSTYIPASQEHLQIWGINGTASLSQTVTDLPDGQYQLGVTVVPSGNVTATLFSGEQKASTTAEGILTLNTTVTDGQINFGITISSNNGATIDFDDFTLKKIGEATGVEVPVVDKKGINSAVYDLMGRRVEKTSKGIYIVNGKKVVINGSL